MKAYSGIRGINALHLNLVPWLLALPPGTVHPVPNEYEARGLQSWPRHFGWEQISHALARIQTQDSFAHSLVRRLSYASWVITLRYETQLHKKATRLKYGLSKFHVIITSLLQTFFIPSSHVFNSNLRSDVSMVAVAQTVVCWDVQWYLG